MQLGSGRFCTFYSAVPSAGQRGVKMQCILLNKAFLFSLGLLLTLQGLPIPAAIAAQIFHYPPTASSAQKTYRVAIIMVNTTGISSDNPKTKHKLEFYRPEDMGDLFFNHQNGVRSFIEEASYDQVTLSGSVAGWYTTKKRKLQAKDIISNYHKYVGLAADDLDFSKYDVFILNCLVTGRGGQVGWLYGQQQIKTRKGTFRKVGLMFMISSSVFEKVNLNYSQSVILPSTSWAHELLHTLGIRGHANSYDCGRKTTCFQGPNPIKAYGNPFSLLGESAFAVHPDVLMKSRLGWLKPTQITDASKSGIYRIYPLETDDGQIKGLKIPLEKNITHRAHKAAFNHIFVEYRQPVGFDRLLERLEGGTFLKRYKGPGSVDSNGVLVYLGYTDEKTDSSALLDMNPGSEFNPKRGIKWPGNAGKFSDAFLTTGQTFYENVNKLCISTVGPTEDGGMEVKVDFGCQAGDRRVETEN